MTVDPADREPLPRTVFERIRALGYAVVPLSPSDEMAWVGALSCFTVPDSDFESACRDAAECCRAMVEFGSL